MQFQYFSKAVGADDYPLHIKRCINLNLRNLILTVGNNDTALCFGTCTIQYYVSCGLCGKSHFHSCRLRDTVGKSLYRRQAYAISVEPSLWFQHTTKRPIRGIVERNAPYGRTAEQRNPPLSSSTEVLLQVFPYCSRNAVCLHLRVSVMYYSYHTLLCLCSVQTRKQTVKTLPQNTIILKGNNRTILCRIGLID